MNRKDEKANRVPIWYKANLTIEEAAEYTSIGRDKLYDMTNQADCPFVLWIGSKRLIKRKRLEEFLDTRDSI